MLPASSPQTKRSVPTTSSIPPTRPSQEDWIRSRVDVTGPIEEESAQPWGLVLRVPTDEGTVFYKEPAPEYAHEARVIELLAQRRPAAVPKVVASDDAGRMLMLDAGEQLNAVLERDRDPRYWEEALPVYAELQLAVARDAEKLMEAGAFDRRLASLPDLTRGIPELSSLLPEVVRLCDRLRSVGVPETIQSDDLTSANVFLQENTYRFIDWGFACVSHPFFALAVTQRAIERRFALSPGSKEMARLRAAYLEPFTAAARSDELESVTESARRLGQICRIALRAESRWRDEQGDLASTVQLLLDPDAWRRVVS
jgi:phosphotransferase family enzyme